jgi:hypothetical protein
MQEQARMFLRALLRCLRLDPFRVTAGDYEHLVDERNAIAAW